MLPDATLPAPSSLVNLLAVLFPLFTAPSFRTFCGLACGFLAQTGKRTVCGMLTGAGLAQVWPHDRAHWFFSRARWNPDALGIAVAKLVVALLVPAGKPVTIAIDDTLFKRRGKKVWAASWFHDGSAAGPDKTGYGNNWVIAAIIVRLPFLDRPAAIPVLAKLVIKGTNSKSRLWLAARMAHMIADAFPGRQTGVVADSAYAGAELNKLPAQITWTTRLRKDAALCALPPQRTGKPGRPRAKGDRLPSLDKLAATATWQPVTATRYRTTAATQAAVITCLWYSVFGTRQVHVVLIRDRSATGYDLALVTTDLNATAAHVIERYASRWSIEMVFSQLAKGPVWPVGGGWQHVADLDLAAGDDHAVDEQLGQLPPLGEGGGGQPGPDGAAEPPDPAGDGLQFEPLPGGGLQLPLLGQQRGVAAV
jgi:DDE superfamily endonuclease